MHEKLLAADMAGVPGTDRSYSQVTEAASLGSSDEKFNQEGRRKNSQAGDAVPGVDGSPAERTMAPLGPR